MLGLGIHLGMGLGLHLEIQLGLQFRLGLGFRLRLGVRDGIMCLGLEFRGMRLFFLSSLV